VAETSEFSLHPGDQAPDFSLPAVDGRTYSRKDFDAKPFLLVVFWCNHCPYVQAWENRMIELGRRFGPRGVAVALINANDGWEYPDDRMERMIERASDHNYPFPYLRDETQEVAHAYGALVTPHPMLFGPERRLIFQGAIDDQYDRPEAVRHRYLEDAIEAVLAGRPVPAPELPVRGCSVKWRA
jgi:peroxiredoxin